MEKIKKIIETTLKALGFEAQEINIKKDNLSKDREVMDVDIIMDFRDADDFMRDGAEGLNALQHIVRLLFSKEATGTFLVLDINGHKEKRKNELNDIAIEIAKKVRRTKESITMEPMSAYERRIIHLKLAEQPDIVTESIGEEPERKLVVRLYP
ncbi:MAG: R3H domain-containing nucleic acid-binding protein [Patescibacteria group bacterium]